MKRKIITLITACSLAIALLLNFTGCTLKTSAVNLMDGIKARELQDQPVSRESAEKAAEFAVQLFRACCNKDKNTLVSPLSVLAALAMTANGAKGETKEQMENILGMTTDELNEFFRSYRNALTNSGKNKLSLANSIWFTDDESFTVNRDFLQTNADYYDADAYKARFDGTTLKDINNWVKSKTDGMIPEILDNIPREAVMYLVNALAFEAEWAEPYKSYQVREGNFTLENGLKKKTDFMYSTEHKYIEDDMATGFIKYYSGGKYAFVALLPDEGATLSDYIASLEGKTVLDILENASDDTVYSSVPKFETEFSAELSDVLKALGMPAAFDGNKADFSGLGTSSNGNIFINRVLHKTYISVTELGTKAGASTVVGMEAGSAFFEEPKEVNLNRPFVYMLIDTEYNLPFFIGAMTDTEG